MLPEHEAFELLRLARGRRALKHVDDVEMDEALLRGRLAVPLAAQVARPEIAILREAVVVETVVVDLPAHVAHVPGDRPGLLVAEPLLRAQHVDLGAIDELARQHVPAVVLERERRKHLPELFEPQRVEDRREIVEGLERQLADRGPVPGHRRRHDHDDRQLPEPVHGEATRMRRGQQRVGQPRSMQQAARGPNHCPQRRECQQSAEGSEQR